MVLIGIAYCLFVSYKTMRAKKSKAKKDQRKRKSGSGGKSPSKSPNDVSVDFSSSPPRGSPNLNRYESYCDRASEGFSSVRCRW